MWSIVITPQHQISCRPLTARGVNEHPVRPCAGLVPEHVRTCTLNLAKSPKGFLSPHRGDPSSRQSPSEAWKEVLGRDNALHGSLQPPGPLEEGMLLKTMDPFWLLFKKHQQEIAFSFFGRSYSACGSSLGKATKEMRLFIFMDMIWSKASLKKDGSVVCNGT